MAESSGTSHSSSALVKLFSTCDVTRDFASGMTDADAHAAIIRTERGGDGAQTVVAGVATARLHFDLARGKIDFVMDDDKCVSGSL